MSQAGELSEARHRFPVGDRVRGRISALPWGPGLTGLFVDLGAAPDGFVDVLHLPEDPGHWPSVGHEGLFEVLKHRPGQVRLFPLDASMRSKRYRVSLWPGNEWTAITARYPVGSVVTGTVTDLFLPDREYAVRFPDFWSVVQYDGAPPAVGSSGAYIVTRQLEWTRRLLVNPVE
ncbi:hypothetical protein [Actinoplanes subtropicus]|uniref:hypothetical protein n=1 Tax=Actinoplanes subtropicus TaxID=543632 RepID=UPI0012F98724|nr:hypothetical protein [Actinoplanes subtropicus]